MEQRIAVRQVFAITSVAMIVILLIGFVQVSMQYSDLQRELTNTKDLLLNEQANADYANEAWAQVLNDLSLCVNSKE